MKLITRSIFATLLVIAILLQSSPVKAGRKCKHQNKHCIPVATLTATPLMHGTPVYSTPIIYTCQSLNCQTPGK